MRKPVRRKAAPAAASTHPARFDCGGRSQAIDNAESARPGGYMTTFDDRERGFEGKFALDQEQEFKAQSRAARLLAEWESPTLPEVIRDINKYSNNVMARQVLLTLAANILHVPGTQQGGAQVIQTWLAGKGIAAPELVIDNGSGLSRNARISARTMARLLIAAYQSPLMPEFISSMPLVGYDGTMRNRLQDKSVAGNAHIKTGRLDDARAMAGYVLAGSGKRYVVVCIINHHNAARGQEAQDALLQWVYEHG